MSAKFCHACINWEKIDKSSNDSLGMCHDVMVPMKVVIQKEDIYEDTSSLWTNGYFGCIYWRENDGSLLDTDEIVNDELM